jgi:hypothetical protein
MIEVNAHGFWRFRSVGENRFSLIAVALAVVCSGIVSISGHADTNACVNEPMPLDAKRLFALGMIESGNDDRGVGPAGEVSRYQIQPSVWKTYSESRDYREPELARSVACQHWNYLVGYFSEKTGRAPTDSDMYILWNTRFGYYASKGFDSRFVNGTVRDRARRFVNLVNR